MTFPTANEIEFCATLFALVVLLVQVNCFIVIFYLAPRLEGLKAVDCNEDDQDRLFEALINKKVHCVFKQKNEAFITYLSTFFTDEILLDGFLYQSVFPVYVL